MEVLITQFPSWQVTPYYATGLTFSHAMYSFFGDVLDLDLVASQLGFWYKVNPLAKSYRSE